MGENVPVPPKPRRSPRQEESRIQCACIRWWSVNHARFGVPEIALYSVPNGGYRDERTAAILKREGLRAGACDLVLDVARGRFHGARVELKTAEGRPSKAQEEFIAMLNAQGYCAVVKYGYGEAIAFLAAYLNGAEKL